MNTHCFVCKNTQFIHVKDGMQYTVGCVLFFFVLILTVLFVAFDIDRKNMSMKKYLHWDPLEYGKNRIKFELRAGDGWHYLDCLNISDPILKDDKNNNKKSNDNENDKTGKKDKNERQFDVIKVVPSKHFLPFHSVNIKCISNGKYWTHRNELEEKEFKMDCIYINDSDSKSYDDSDNINDNSNEMIQFSHKENICPDEYNEHLFFIAPIHLCNFTNEYYIGYLDTVRHKKCFEKKSGFDILFGRKKKHKESSYHEFLSLLSYVYFDHQTKILKITNDRKKATSYVVKYTCLFVSISLSLNTM